MSEPVNILDKEARIGSFAGSSTVASPFISPAQQTALRQTTPVRPSFTPESPIQSEEIEQGLGIGAADLIKVGAADSLIGMGLSRAFDTVERDSDTARFNEALNAYGQANPVSTFIGTMAGRFAADAVFDVATGFMTTKLLSVGHTLLKNFGTSRLATSKFAEALKDAASADPKLMNRIYRNTFEGGATEIVMESVLQEMGKAGGTKDILVAGFGGALLSPAFGEAFRALSKLPGWTADKWRSDTVAEAKKAAEAETGQKMSNEEVKELEDSIKGLLPERSEAGEDAVDFGPQAKVTDTKLKTEEEKLFDIIRKESDAAARLSDTVDLEGYRQRVRDEAEFERLLDEEIKADNELIEQVLTEEFGATVQNRRQRRAYDRAQGRIQRAEAAKRKLREERRAAENKREEILRREDEQRLNDYLEEVFLDGVLLTGREKAALRELSDGDLNLQKALPSGEESIALREGFESYAERLKGQSKKLLGDSEDISKLSKDTGIPEADLLEFRERAFQLMREDQARNVLIPEVDARARIASGDAPLVAPTAKDKLTLPKEVRTVQEFVDMVMHFGRANRNASAYAKLAVDVIRARARIAGKKSANDYLQGKKLKYQDVDGNTRIILEDTQTLIQGSRNSNDMAELFHEIGHVLEQDLSAADRAILAKTYLKVGDDRLTDNILFGRAFSERFANDFVTYLDDVVQGRKNDSPKELKGVFAKVADWFKEVYGAIFNKDYHTGQMSAPVRDVFDRLFRSDEIVPIETRRAEFIRRGREARRGEAQLESTEEGALTTEDVTPDMLEATTTKQLNNMNNAEANDVGIHTEKGVGTLFSGGGTLEAALPKHKGIFASEYDLKRAEAFFAAHGYRPDTRDVLDMTNDELVQAFRGVDLASFSPVCVRFSSMASARNKKPLPIDMESARKVAAVIDGAKPPAVNIENAPAYLDSPEFKIIKDALDRQGYKYGKENIFEATDYGAATRRKRMVFRAVRNGELPSLPAKTGPKDWFPIIEEDLKTAKKTTESATDKKEIEKGIKSGRLTRDLPIYTTGIGSGSYAQAGGPTTAFLAGHGKPKVFMPNGDVLEVTPRMMAKLMDLPDSYVLPKPDTLARSIIGNGVNGMITKKVIAPLLDTVPTRENTLEATTAAEAQRLIDNNQVIAKNAAQLNEDIKAAQKEIPDSASGKETLFNKFRRFIPEGFVSGIMTPQTLFESLGPTMAKHYAKLRDAVRVEAEVQKGHYDSFKANAERHKFTAEDKLAITKGTAELKGKERGLGEILLLHMYAKDKGQHSANKAMEKNGYRFKGEKKPTEFTERELIDLANEDYLEQTYGAEMARAARTLTDTLKETGTSYNNWYKGHFNRDAFDPDKGYFPKKTKAAPGESFEGNFLQDDFGETIDLSGMTEEQIDEAMKKLVSRGRAGDKSLIMKTLAETTSTNKARRGLGIVEFQDPFDATVRYMNQQARLQALAEPLAEAQIMANALRSDIEELAGQDIYSALTKTLTRTAGALDSADPITNKWASTLYKGQVLSALSWNLSTPLKQIPSFVMALNRLDLPEGVGGAEAFRTYMSSATKKAKEGEPSLHDDMMERFPTYAIRYMTSGQSPDLSDVNLADAAHHVLFGDVKFTDAVSAEGVKGGAKNFVEKGMLGIREFDAAAIRAIYLAAQDSIEFKKGSKATDEEIEKLAQQIIDETQPTYHPLTRTNLQSSNSFLQRQMAMFSSQPTKNFNMVLRDIQALNTLEGAEREAAVKRLQKTLGMLAVQSAMIAGAGMAAGKAKQGIFDLITDEEVIDQRNGYLESHGLETARYWNEAFRATFGNLPYSGPYLGEAMQRLFIGDGFDIELMPFGFLNDMYGFLEAVNQQGDIGRQAMNVGAELAKFTGTPTPVVQATKAAATNL